jgi:hypothetical protein
MAKKDTLQRHGAGFHQKRGLLVKYIIIKYKYFEMLSTFKNRLTH